MLDNVLFVNKDRLKKKKEAMQENHTYQDLSLIDHVSRYM